MILKAYRLLLTSLFLEGLLAFIWLFSERSMQRNAALFGFSASRIALGALTLFALALLVWWALMAVREAPALLRFDQHLEYFNQHQSHLLVIFTGLGLVFFIILFFLVIFPGVGPLTSSFLSSPFDDLISTIIAIINRIRPLLVWALLAILQTVIFLFTRFRKTCCQNGFFSLDTVYYLSLSTFILPVTLFHWAILYYQLYVFTAIPYWFWKFFDKPSVNEWLFIPLSIIAILIVSFVLWFPKKTRRNLILLLVMGYLLQIGFGFIEDSGIERLRRNFIEKGHHGYAQ